MAAKAINQNNIVDIIRFYNDTMKVIEKENVDVKSTKKSLHTLNSVSGQIIEFYKTSNAIAKSVMESSVRFKQSVFNAQKLMIESIKSIATSINEFNELDLPSTLVIRIKLWKLKNETDEIINMFLGENGFVDIIVGFLESPRFKTLNDTTIHGQIEIVIRNIDELKRLVDVIESINAIVTPIVELEKIKFSPDKVNKLISNIDAVIITISKFSQNTKNTKFAGIKPQITTIKNIIDSMLSIVKDICLLALASVPIALAVGPALLTLWIVSEFIKIASKIIVEIASEKDFALTYIATVNITKIIGLMLLNVVMVLGTLILIANALPVLRESANESIAAFAVIGLVVTAIAGLAWLINKIFSAGVGRQVYEGLLLMIALIGVMLTATGMILLLAYAGVVFFTNNVWLYATGMFLVTGAVVLAIAGLGYLIALWLPGITSFTTGIVLVMISITAMLLVGLELNALARFEFGEEKREAIKASTIAIIGAAHDVMDAVFNGTNGDDINRYDGGAFGRFFRSIFKGAAFMIEALTASFTLVMTTISVTMMLLVAYELEVLTKFNIDRGAVLGSVNSIMGTANTVIDAIFQPAEDKNTPGGSGFGGAIGHFFTGVADIIELIVSIGKVALTMTAIGMVMLLAFELKGVAKIQFNPDEVVNNVNQIMGAADACIRAIFAPSTEPNTGNESKWSKFVGFIKTTLGNVGGFIESVLGIGKLAPMMVAMGMISFLANTIKSINDIAKDVNKKAVLDNTGLILGVTDEIVKKVFTKNSEYDIDKKKLKSFNALTDSLGGFVKVFNVDMTKVEKGTNKMIEFVEKIDNAKIENLQTAANIFGQMVEFSKSINGNFEGLAETINEKILPLLEQLNELLGKAEGLSNGSINVNTTPTTAPTQQAPTAATAPNNTVNYTASINAIRQELVKICDTLTDGSQRTTIEER